MSCILLLQQAEVTLLRQSASLPSSLLLWGTMAGVLGGLDMEEGVSEGKGWSMAYVLGSALQNRV